ncbi:TolB family protein [Aquimarina algiphila]|uniref:TolB family protein n=1 Tax=Aquimarina algiphila TaxID=2047982 RepID=UPI00232F6C34|nr:DUF5050 domain-containing protein [Aquimarina algiphila]
MKVTNLKQVRELYIIIFLLLGFIASCQKSDKSKLTFYTIAYSSVKTGNIEIYSGSVKGKSTIKSTNENGGYVAWSPDGKQFAFYGKYDDKKTWSIHTMNIDGTNRKRMTHAKNKWDNAPDWSPDGKKIVFAREYKDSEGVWHPEIWIMNSDGSEQTQIKSLKGSNPYFTPDGRIVFSREFEDKSSAISIADIDGKNIIQLTHNNAKEWHPEVSPDGDQIAFMSNRDGNFEIYVMNIDGSNQKRLIHNDVDDWYPSWSPDGSQLIFSIATGEGREDRTIYIMNKDGSSIRKIIAHGSQAAWLKTIK